MTIHPENHFTSGEVVRDVVIGMADGLTVPFALAAGLAGATDAVRIVITAGSAEVAAGSIAMGLGGFLAARSDVEHWRGELARERREIVERPADERAEVAEVLTIWGLSQAEAAPVVEALARRPEEWVRFMMRFELGLQEPDPNRAWRSALTIGASYVVGGAVPLAPYLFVTDAQMALGVSACLTLLVLAVFGGVKSKLIGGSILKGALGTALVGGLAAGAAFLIARLVQGAL